MIPRFFAQIFGFRFCCPKCGDLSTFRRGGKAGRGGEGFNRITGKCHCGNCHKAFYVGLVLYEVIERGSAGKGGHPDQTPTLREVEMIRAEAELKGWFIQKKTRLHDPVNRALDHVPLPEDFEED